MSTSSVSNKLSVNASASPKASKASNASPNASGSPREFAGDAELGVNTVMFKHTEVDDNSRNRLPIRILSSFKQEAIGLMSVLKLARDVTRSTCDANKKKDAIAKAIVARKHLQDKLVKFLVSDKNGKSIVRMGRSEIFANREYCYDPNIGDSHLLMDIMLSVNIVLPNHLAMACMRYRVAKLFGYTTEFANNPGGIVDRLDRIMYFMFYHRGIVCNERSRNALNGYPHQLLDLLQKIRIRLTPSGVFTLYQSETVDALVAVLNLERLAYIKKNSIPTNAGDDKHELVGEFLSHLFATVSTSRSRCRLMVR